MLFYLLFFNPKQTVADSSWNTRTRVLVIFIYKFNSNSYLFPGTFISHPKNKRKNTNLFSISQFRIKSI